MHKTWHKMPFGCPTWFSFGAPSGAASTLAGRKMLHQIWHISPMECQEKCTMMCTYAHICTTNAIRYHPENHPYDLQYSRISTIIWVPHMVLIWCSLRGKASLGKQKDALPDMSHYGNVREISSQKNVSWTMCTRRKCGQNTITFNT